ncbi:MAG TPA: NAD-dependent epimerase/dehydratase family protein [Chloroflexota bacterium]
MRVFITGGTGTIGEAVIKELRRAGHAVTGLSRSEASDTKLRALGATPHRGLLDQPASYQSAAAAHAALLHVAFDYGNAIATDCVAIEALLAAAKGASAPRVVVYTSGVLVLGNTGTPADESASTEGAIPMIAWRPAHERLTLEAANDAITTAVIRPGFVYGGTKSLIASYAESARATGAAVYIGDGKNRMPFVHRDDLAVLYRLVIEKRAQGIFHGVDGASPSLVSVARAVSAAMGTGGETSSLPVEEARARMGLAADALCTDQLVVTKRSAGLGWRATHPPLDTDSGVEAAVAEWKREVGA